MRDQDRRLRAPQPQQFHHPIGEGRGIQAVDRIGLSEPRYVGDDEPVVLPETGEDGRPVDATALDATVQQHQRRTIPGLEQRRTNATDVEPPRFNG
jgi:hypothetical protein